MKCILPLWLALGAACATAGEIVVDAFDRLPQSGLAQAVSVTESRTFDQSRDDSGGVLGGHRLLQLEVRVDAVGGSASTSTDPPPPGLAINNVAGMLSTTTVLWDARGWGLNHFSLGDITGGGSNDRLLVGLLNPLVGNMALRFDLVSGDTDQYDPNFQCEKDAVPGEHACIQATIPNGYADDVVEFLFDDFIVGDGFYLSNDLNLPNDFTKLFSIAMVVTSPDDGFSTTISYVKAVGPQSVPVPATLPIVMLGLMGMALARGPSRRS